jgi:biopolymer transport protein ExbD
MAFGSLSNQDNHDLAEINMVPLIDVMLVLLVIFIVAAPMVTQSVKVNLPQATAVGSVQPPKPVVLGIDAQGELSWQGQPIDTDALKAALQTAAATRPAPDVQLQADRLTPYEAIAQVMALASQAGVQKLGFVSLPQQP